MKLYSIATSLLLSISAVVADDKATPIFNGKDLAGWSVKSNEEIAQGGEKKAK